MNLHFGTVIEKGSIPVYTRRNLKNGHQQNEVRLEKICSLKQSCNFGIISICCYQSLNLSKGISVNMTQHDQRIEVISENIISIRHRMDPKSFSPESVFQRLVPLCTHRENCGTPHKYLLYKVYMGVDY